MATFSLSLERFAYDYHSMRSTPRRILLHTFEDGSRAGLRRALQAATPPAAPPAPVPVNPLTPPPPPPRSSTSAFQTLDPTVVIILVVLLFALICAAFLNSIMRCLLRRARGRRAQAAAAAAAGGRASQSSAPGLDPKSLASLPVLTFNGSDKSLCKEASADCAICLSEFVQSEKLRLLPKCSHVFHLDCIDMWLQSHVSCPVCRDDIEDEDLVPVPPDSEDQHSPARGALIPMILIRDRNGQASASAAPPGGETPDLHAELLRDSAGRSSGGASVSSQQQQGESSSRRSLRSTLSSMFAADHFFSARWQASSSSSSGAVAAVTPATARSQSARASG